MEENNALRQKIKIKIKICKAKTSYKTRVTSILLTKESGMIKKI